jgi:transcription initiation factor TFIIB
MSSFDYNEVMQILDQIVKDKMKKQYKQGIDENQLSNSGRCVVYKCLCESLPVIHETDDSLVCVNCGLVLENVLISEEKEWRDFYSDDTGTGGSSMNRCGMPYDELLPNNSLSSMIAGNGRMQKLNMWMSMTYEEKVIIDLKKRLEGVALDKGISRSVVRHALILFKKMNNLKTKEGKKQVHRGRVRDGLIAACFYYACKNGKCNIQTNDIIISFGIDIKIFSKACKMYIENFNDDVDKTSASPSDFIIRFSNSLGISYNIQKICIKVIDACEDLMLLKNYSPQSVTSGVVYFVSIEMGLKFSKSEISKTGDTSEDRITVIFKILRSKKVEIFNIIKYGNTGDKK